MQVVCLHTRRVWYDQNYNISLKQTRCSHAHEPLPWLRISSIHKFPRIPTCSLENYLNMDRSACYEPMNHLRLSAVIVRLFRVWCWSFIDDWLQCVLHIDQTTNSIYEPQNWVFIISHTTKANKYAWQQKLEWIAPSPIIHQQRRSGSQDGK